MNINADEPIVDLESIAEEMQYAGSLELVMPPEKVLALVGVVQLALRHPSLASSPSSAFTAQTARDFLRAARQYFAHSPEALRLINLGDDPDFDLPRADGERTQ